MKKICVTILYYIPFHEEHIAYYRKIINMTGI